MCAYPCDNTCRALAILRFALGIPLRNMTGIGRISRAQTYVFCRAPTWSKCRGFTRIARRESSWASCTRTRGLCTTVSAKAPRSLVSLNYSRLLSCILYTCIWPYVAAPMYTRWNLSHDATKIEVFGCTMYILEWIHIKVDGENANKNWFRIVEYYRQFCFVYDVTFRF